MESRRAEPVAAAGATAGAAQDGRANEELVRFLAEALGCRKAAVRLVRGASARRKQLELPAACAERLPAGRPD